MNKTATLMISVVLILATFGIVMLASTSGVAAAASKACHYDAYFFVKRQALFLAIGLLALGAGMFLDYHYWRRYYWLLGAVAFVLLVMVAMPKIGLEIKGSRRWLRAGPLTIQPSEVAKFVVIVLLARWMTKHSDRVGGFWYGLALPGVLLGLFVIPIAAEPDFGTTILCGCAGLTIMFIGGAPVSYLLVGGLAGALGLTFVIMHNANRMGRIMAFLDPEKYAKTEAYQLLQGIYAFVTGGPAGVGFGNSLQKQFYLPEAHTDFIFPIIGEELGILASLGVVVFFVIFFICGLRISSAATDAFGRLVAFGITTLITLQAAFNIAVVTGCLPTKGLPLPFISYGGTSLVVSLGMVGVLANIARAAHAEHSAHLGNIKDLARRI